MRILEEIFRDLEDAAAESGQDREAAAYHHASKLASAQDSEIRRLRAENDELRRVNYRMRMKT